MNCSRLQNLKHQTAQVHKATVAPAVHYCDCNAILAELIEILYLFRRSCIPPITLFSQKKISAARCVTVPKLLHSHFFHPDRRICFELEARKVLTRKLNALRQLFSPASPIRNNAINSLFCSDKIAVEGRGPCRINLF